MSDAVTDLTAQQCRLCKYGGSCSDEETVSSGMYVPTVHKRQECATAYRCVYNYIYLK